MGGEAAELTQAGNKFLFRTSFGQQSSMPKVAKYIHDEIKARSSFTPPFGVLGWTVRS